MAAKRENSPEEVRHLRRCINDLVSILALPAIWSGGGPSRVLENLLDALESILNLDFIYARLSNPGSLEHAEMMRVGPALQPKPQPREIRERLQPLLTDPSREFSTVVSNFFEGRDIAIVSLRLGLHGEMGILVAGSGRPDFPQLTEKLVLDVAANQAAIGLHGANIVRELDQTAAERAAQLKSSNEELLETRAALEKAFDEIKRSEAKLRQVIDAIPTMAWCNLPDGPNEFLNKSWHEYTGLAPEASHGWGWQAAFHPDDLPPLLTHWQKMLVTEEPGEIEARIRRDDGVYRWFLIRAEPFHENGKLVRWYGTSTDIDDRKRAEEALRDSEERSRLILDGIAGLVAIMGPTGDVEAVNRQVFEYFGKSIEELKGWSVSDSVHPDDLPGVISAWRHSIETLSPYDVDHRLRRADNVYRWFHARGLPLLDPDGRVARWYILLTDIDDRRRAEVALRASERELSLIVNSIPALAWSARPDGSAEFFNKHYVAYVGLPPEQLQGAGWTAAVHPDDLGLLLAAWQSMMATGKGGEVEGRLRRSDGEYRWFLFRTNPMLDESGKIVKWFGTNAEIHGRKQAEERLQRSEAFLAEGQKLSSVGNFSWLVATDEIKWSEQLYRIFEFEPGEPVTFELIGSRVHPEDHPLLFDLIGKAQRGVSDFEYEHRLLMPDRSIKYLHMIGHRNRDHRGRWEYLGAVQDITQRRQAEEALGKARSDLANLSRVSSLGVLTAAVAHEVNQPLSGIITNASTCLRMLSAEPPNVDGARETARRAIRDGNRAADVVARLRTLYSKKDLSPESMDLNEATREVISLSMSELQSKRVILRHELADDLPSVIGDRLQLQQVILNLLRNAADAMSGVEDRPRELLIKTECDEEDRVRLSVKDAGVGISPQAADKLFEAFFTTKTDGMGIGLSVSRSIIEAHRGRLWAIPNPGPGATFLFSIPRRFATSGSAGGNREI